MEENNYCCSCVISTEAKAMKRPMSKLKKGQVKVYIDDYGSGEIYLRKKGYTFTSFTIMSKKRYDRIKGAIKAYNRAIRELYCKDTWFRD